jgi:nucleoid-associated protein YgaU
VNTKYSQDSRYELSSDRKKAFRKVSNFAVSGKYSLHIIKEGDTIENLANRLLGDPSRYWEIADMNPQVKFQWDLVPGDSIRIPS